MKLLVAALAVSAAFGQDTQRVFHFNSVTSPAQLQEVTNIFRTIADIKDVTPEFSQKIVTATADATKLAILEWLAPRLDSPTPASDIYQIPGTADDIVRVIDASGAKTAGALQQLVNIARTAADINRVFPYNTSKLMVVRASSDRAKLAAWSVQQLLSPPSSPVAEYMLAEDNSRLPSKRVHIYFLSKATNPTEVQQLVNVVRTAADINRVFPFNEGAALVVRGSDSSMQLADWLVRALDIAPPGGGVASEHVQIMTPYPDPATEERILYFPLTATPEALNATLAQIRAGSGLLRAFPFNAARAVVIRGTAGQVAKAEEIVESMRR